MLDLAESLEFVPLIGPHFALVIGFGFISSALFPTLAVFGVFRGAAGFPWTARGLSSLHAQVVEMGVLGWVSGIGVWLGTGIGCGGRGGSNFGLRRFRGQAFRDVVGIMVRPFGTGG